MIKKILNTLREQDYPEVWADKILFASKSKKKVKYYEVNN